MATLQSQLRTHKRCTTCGESIVKGNIAKHSKQCRKKPDRVSTDNDRKQCHDCGQMVAISIDHHLRYSCLAKQRLSRETSRALALGTGSVGPFSPALAGPNIQISQLSCTPASNTSLTRDLKNAWLERFFSTAQTPSQAPDVAAFRSLFENRKLSDCRDPAEGRPYILPADEMINGPSRTWMPELRRLCLRGVLNNEGAHYHNGQSHEVITEESRRMEPIDQLNVPIPAHTSYVINVPIGHKFMKITPAQSWGSLGMYPCSDDICAFANLTLEGTVVDLHIGIHVA